jgi:hypothetical protein
MRKLSIIIVMFGCLVGASTASAATVKLFSKSGFARTFDQHGRTVPSSSKQKPQPGWGFIGTGRDYVGTAASHSPTPVGSDSFFCVVVKWPYADCNGQVAVGASVVDTVVTHHNLAHEGSLTQAFRVTFSTGIFTGARTIHTTSIPKINGEEFTIPVS